jgi:hypothetical protein
MLGLCPVLAIGGGMKNRFKGKTCIYCAVPECSEDGDHVLCRQFLLERHRGDPAKVPACKACNGRKGALEQYLTTVMLFGGRHADATESLESMGPKRLRGNLKLTRELAAGIEYAPPIDSSGHVSMTVPFDSEQLRELYLSVCPVFVRELEQRNRALDARI